MQTVTIRYIFFNADLLLITYNTAPVPAKADHTQYLFAAPARHDDLPG